MAYLPKIITGKVKDTGYPIDGHVLYFSMWDYDKRELWRLHGWDDTDDEAVMLTMFQKEVGEKIADTGKGPEIRKEMLDTFTEKWKAKQWVPEGPFFLLPDLVEVQQVIQEEKKDEAREKLIANGFDLRPRYESDRGGILCLPLDKNLNGDTQAKHPDWVAIDCPNCAQKCWKQPEADKMQEEQGVQFLCTECALTAGLVAPYQKNAPKPGGNRAQRRRAKREQRKKSRNN